jgi:hypothetical protein
LGWNTIENSFLQVSDVLTASLVLEHFSSSCMLGNYLEVESITSLSLVVLKEIDQASLFVNRPTGLCGLSWLGGLGLLRVGKGKLRVGRNGWRLSDWCSPLCLAFFLGSHG